ncbi:MAG: hypothetical protein ACI9MC_003737 [Kiritimatiellia bacterium]|jgi:hypothetical protein
MTGELSTSHVDPFEQVRDALRRHYGGHPWLIATDVLVSGGRLAQRLAAVGAERCFIVASYRGTGPEPDPELAAWHLLGLPKVGMMAAIHASQSALQSLPDEAVRAVHAFDTEERMRVLGAIFSNGLSVAGRPFFGARRANWQALEDKVVIDDVWDAAGVARVPSRVVGVDGERLWAAHLAMDEGSGTVWAGDMREGFHGGAHLTFWVRHKASMEHALACLLLACDTARVMPFMDGLPCSMHGLVMPDLVITTRPAELLTMRSARGNGFVYARAASTWRPDASVLDDLRAMTVQVGEHLRGSVGYRGAFTIDGVMTASGFRPTELNPRVGAAMGLVFPGIDCPLFNALIIEGVEINVDAHRLQAALRQRSMAGARAGATFVTQAVLELSDEVPVRWTGENWEECDEHRSHGAAFWGPGPSGGYGGLYVRPEHLELGPAFGARAASFLAWIDARLGLDLGHLEAALEV